MISLAGQPAEVRFTLDIKRATTGLTETIEMVGLIQPDQETQAAPLPEIEGVPV